MRSASAATIARILSAESNALTATVLPFITDRGSQLDVLRLNSMTTPERVLAETEAFTNKLLGSINVVGFRRFMLDLDLDLIVLPEPSMNAYVVPDERVVVLHKGLDEFLRSFSALWCLLQRTSVLERKLASEPRRPLPPILSAISLDGLSLALIAKLYGLAMGPPDPCSSLDAFDEAMNFSFESMNSGITSFVLLHEYGHLLGAPAWPYGADFAFEPDPDFQVVAERIDEPDFAEYMADHLAIASAPEYCRPWLLASATLFLGVHSIFEDLCYDNRNDHPRAANRLSFMLRKSQLDESQTSRMSSMLEVGIAVTRTRTASGLADEPLEARRSRMARFVKKYDTIGDLAPYVSALASVTE